MAHRHADSPQHHGHESWDEHAPAYARQADASEPGLRAAAEALLDAVHAGPGVRLLDLACGPGHTTAAAHARGATVLGTDLSAGMVEQARRRFPHVAFEVRDMAEPPPGPWDAIMCRDGHHANPAWMATAFLALRSGGRIGLAETEPSGPNDQGGKAPAAAWLRRLQEAGFTDVATRPVKVHRPESEGRTGQRVSQMWIISGRKP